MLASMKKKRLTSTASVATNKGLLNEPGENNCFLNSAIQVLWHLDVFRRSFRLLSGHACMGASCIFCALKEIFDQFQYSKDQSLTPNVLRSALAESFQQQNRFQLGLMDDAAECFENILNRIHIHIGNTVHEDVCTAPHCIPHQKLGLTLVQHSVCACGATSEPLPFIEMVHYVSATALCVENDAMRQRYGASGVSQMFGRLIRVAGSWGDMRSCPSECGQKVEMRKVLMNCPDVVSIGIVWDSEEPDVKQIVDLVNALGTTLRLTDLFHTVVDERASHLEMYLVGMVCYYGKHYSTFFFHTKLRKWVYFDDAQVSEVGKRWSNVISKCIKGHHQPLLLLYANPNASPVTVATAPQHTTLLPGYSNQHHVIDTLIEIPETNSLASEGDGSVIDDESSETESMQASNDHPHRWSGEVKYQDHPHETRHAPSVSRKQSTKSEKGRSTYSVDRANEKAAKHKKRHSHEIRQLADVKISVNDHQEEARKHEGSRSRRSAFQWNVTDEQSRSSHNTKMGNYVEPQPANWTKYEPYSHSPHKSQHAHSSMKPDSNRKNVKVSPDRSLYSVKAVDTKGMAAFCVTGNTSSGAHEIHSSNPNPSARSKHADHVSIGRRSPGSSRRSSQSSQSSHSSVGKSSHKSGSSANSAAKSAHSAGSHHPRSVTPDFDEDSLHVSSQSYNSRNCIDLMPILFPAVIPPTQTDKNRPSLPPKPPFLSRPLSEGVNQTIPLGILTTGKEKGFPGSQEAEVAANQPGIEGNSTLDVDSSAHNTDRCISLFLDADELLEQSRAADARMDYGLALQLCLEATKAIERILMTENLSEEFMIKARIKHGDCVNKSRILHRRRNIRLKSQGKESASSRSSKPEADRHVTSSSNQLLKPTKHAPTNRSNPSSPSATRKKITIGKTSSRYITEENVNDEKAMEQLQENDSNDHLIDFNKHGMTKFQHVVQNMFKRQNDTKDSKQRHHAVMSPDKKSNRVTSSHKKSNSMTPSLKKSNSISSSDGNSNNNSNIIEPVNPVAPVDRRQSNEGKGEQERTNIFVFAKPDSVASRTRPTITQPFSSSELRSSNPEQKDSRKPLSDTNLANLNPTAESKPEKQVVKEVLAIDLPSTAIESAPKFRSITPTPQTSSTPSLSQQRRSKTPTPAMNKELMRTKQSIGQRRGSDLKLRPTSASTGIRPINANLNEKSGPMAAPPPIRPTATGYPYQYPYQAWGNPSLPSPGTTPSYMPREYYEHFYRWLQYYATLSPEQQKSFLSFTPNGNPTLAPMPGVPTSSNHTAPPSMQAAYVEQLKSHLGKNLANFTNSVSRATPQIKAANTSIYEANKPKPVNKSKSSTNIPSGDRSSQASDRQSSLSPEHQSRSSSGLSRKAYVDQNSSSLRKEGMATNEIVASTSRDDKRLITDSQSNSLSSSQSKGFNSIQSPPRQGMLKWAEEGKKRAPESSIEARNRVLQDYRSRRDPNKLNSSNWQHRPTVTVHPSTGGFLSEPSTVSGGNVLTGKADTKCALCGLVDVPSPGDYCSSCLVYLARLKPANKSMRAAKKL